MGTNTIEVKVTAADATTTKTYTVLVTRAAGNAGGRPSISGTATQGRTLTAGQGSVSDSQGVDQSTIRYAWTRCDDNGDNCNVVMGTGTTYTLTAAEIGLRIRVRLSFTDNAGNAEAREGFPWPGRRDNPIAALPAAENATLSALALADGEGAAVALSPVFVETRESYTASVGNAVDEITITPTTGANGATVEYLDAGDRAISDADATATGQQVALAVGANTIKVKVTATDTTTTKTYTVVVTRTVPIDDATLRALALADGDGTPVALAPAFASETESYTASVGNAVDEITITPTTLHDSATVEYLDDTDATIADADGTATGQQVALAVGANTIKVKVTAADTTTTKTYTVAVTRAGTDADATLSALALADTGGTAVTLSPAFASATERYTASVGNAVGEITVSPTASQTGATVAYLDGNAMPIGDANATATGHQVALLVGTNTIEVKVTAADATTTKTYTVLVTRAAGNAGGRPSISGTATQGRTLTAGQGSVSDSQGVDQSTIRYAWTRCDDNGDNCNVVMGTGTTYTLTAAEIGLRIRLTAELHRQRRQCRGARGLPLARAPG